MNVTEGNPKVEGMIWHVLYSCIDDAVDLLAAGDTRNAITKLRRLLPAQYRNTLIKVVS